MKTNNIYTILILLFLSILQACDEDMPTYIITGHCYKSCNYDPLANYELRLHKDGTPSSGIGGKGTPAGDWYATTDSNGYFKFKFQDICGDNLQIVNFTPLPESRSIYNIEIFQKAYYILQTRLNVINPHSQNDTLQIIVNQYFTNINITNLGLYITNLGLYITQIGIYITNLGYKYNKFRVFR